MWRIGWETSMGWVPGTNSFLEGYNLQDKRIRNMLSGTFRTEFSFHPQSKEGQLYPGLYQGIGVGVNTFFAHSLLGTPLSLYVYQGAPIVHLNQRLWLGYEWKFGAAFGWEHHMKDSNDNNSSVSTDVTALIGLGVKLHYQLSRWRVSVGIDGTHFSNGNTSFPNAGVNAIGASIGVAYSLSTEEKGLTTSAERAKGDIESGGWMVDVTAFGAWRKRIVSVYDDPQVCPGKFGVAGLQLSPMYRLNRHVAIGSALDLQWDEGSGLASYWVEGSSGKEIKFNRPPFAKQLAVGVSAHAELTAPLFAINVGMGYNLMNPEGEKRFYQLLALKTFVTRRAYLYTGYRLGSFKDPQNLMLGLGYRF